MGHKEGDNCVAVSGFEIVAEFRLREAFLPVLKVKCFHGAHASTFGQGLSIRFSKKVSISKLRWKPESNFRRFFRHPSPQKIPKYARVFGYKTCCGRLFLRALQTSLTAQTKID